MRAFIDVGRNSRERCPGMLLGVVLLTRMREYERLQSCLIQTLQKRRRLQIGEMSKGAANATLEFRGIGARIEQRRFVIELQHQRITVLIQGLNVRGDRPQVCEQPHTAVAGLQAILYRFPGIVRNGHRLDVDIADGKVIPGIEAAQFGAVRDTPAGSGAVTEIDGNREFSGKGPHTGRVIAMLVSHADGIDGARIQVHPFKPAANFAERKAAVRQYTALLRPDQRGVAPTAAAEGSQL